MRPRVHIDFETFSELSLPDVGAYRYLQHPSTEVMLTALAVGDEEPVVYEGDDGLAALVAGGYLSGEYELCAFNAEFERLVCLYLLRVEVPPEDWVCSMTRAWSQSFVGGLGDVGQQMGIPLDTRKLADGRRVMLKFGKPRKPSKLDDRTRWTQENAADDWALYREYAAQDVVASRAILAECDRYPWPEQERRYWCMDQRINDTGWPVDLLMINNADSVRLAEEQRLMQELACITGLPNPNSRDQMLGWLREHGLPLGDLQKATVALALEASLPPIVRRALEVRQSLARATPKKWAALKRSNVPMPGSTRYGLVNGALKFAAAQRTQRWAGRLLQAQNLYTERVLDTDAIAEVLTYGNRDLVEALYA